jgi:hypothetical protein
LAIATAKGMVAATRKGMNPVTVIPDNNKVETVSADPALWGDWYTFCRHKMKIDLRGLLAQVKEAGFTHSRNFC